MPAIYNIIFSISMSYSAFHLCSCFLGGFKISVNIFGPLFSFFFLVLNNWDLLIMLLFVIVIVMLLIVISFIIIIITTILVVIIFDTRNQYNYLIT